MTATQVPTRPDVPPPPPPRRSRLSLLQRTVLGLLVAAVVLVFGTIAFLSYTSAKIDHIPAEDLPSLQPVAGDASRTFLVVGSDSRENLPDDFADNFGDFAGARADVIMLVHFAPGDRAQMLSLPRDLKVAIPGHGEDRINAAYAFGGPDLMVRTVEAATGIPINHYVEIDFGGFAAVVDALGGVTLDFAYPARDRKSGLEVDAGRQTLNGEQALAYVRSRSYQEYRDGSWVSVGASDIGRAGRQQQLLVRMLDQAASASSTFNLPGFVTTLAENIKADAGLTTGVLVSLGREALAIRSANIERATLPVTDITVGGRYFLVPIEPAASRMLQAFKEGSVLTASG